MAPFAPKPTDRCAGTPRLARALALQGDAVKARAAYEDFFYLWKDADPDVPIYKQAKSEYAKLPEGSVSGSR